MTNEERKALVERPLDALPDITGKSYFWGGLTKEAADQIEADGKRIAELEAALHSAIRNIEVLIGDIEVHTECAECQSGIAAKREAVAEYRAALGEKAGD